MDALKVLTDHSWFSDQHNLLASWGSLRVKSPVALAGEACSATVAAGSAGEIKASGGDGHSLRAEDDANSSRGGGSHNGVLREGAEDGSGQGHHHGGGLDDDGGALALSETGLIAAVGQQDWATGLAWLAGHALVVAGHLVGLEVNL